MTAKGESTKISELLTEAEVITNTIPQISAKADLLIEIAKRQKDLGEASLATVTAEKAIAAIIEIRDESRRVTSLANLSSAVTDISTLSESARNGLVHLVAAAEV